MHYDFRAFIAHKSTKSEAVTIELIEYKNNKYLQFFYIENTLNRSIFTE